MLLGRELAEAKRILEEHGLQYTVQTYHSAKPYGDADSARVVRVREAAGRQELTVCEFKTELKNEASQG